MSKLRSHAAYETDASGIVGLAKEVILPSTIEEVCTAVKTNQHIVIRGGGSGFRGGAVPLNGEDVVLDLSRINTVEDVDLMRKTIEVGAGVIFEDLQQLLEEHELEIGVDLVSSRICTIGGMIATNAVGGRGMKYGRMSTFVRWIDVVDSTGTIIRKGATELSDYVGMEGTTGVIIRACLQCQSLPVRSASLLRIERYEDIELHTMNYKRLPEVSMIEVLCPTISDMLGIGCSYHLLIEYEGEQGDAKGIAYDKLMRLRNLIYGAVAREGYIRIEDVKVQVHTLTKLLSWLTQRRIPFFGHAGMGIIYPCFLPTQVEEISLLFNFISRIGGSVHGSFGVGIQKKAYVEHLDKKIYENIFKRTDLEKKFNQEKLL